MSLDCSRSQGISRTQRAGFCCMLAEDRSEGEHCRKDFSGGLAGLELLWSHPA